MSTPLNRVFEATGCRTQVELAALLGIRQSSISEAKKRNTVPAEWLVTLLRSRSINPEWILSGSGPKHLTRGTRLPQREPSPPAGKEGPPTPVILSHFSSRDLADELLRRTADHG